jgi:AAA domain, putative AbiEii toxin, Type IV TA system
MLKEMHLKRVGSAPEFDVKFADRLNIFTGDNGLGKTFLLDIIWYSLTGTWADRPAFPQLTEETPQISCSFKNQKNSEPKRFYSNFDFEQQQWRDLSFPALLKSLVIYVRVDGGFSVFDPARSLSSAYHFSNYTLWNGLKDNGDKVLSNGLIQDWVKWQNQPNQTIFQQLSRVIKQLSAHPNEWMEPGEPMRVSVEDVRDIPTIKMPYGTVPVIHSSAGMKRILGLAYLLVWGWYEHLQASKLRKKQPVDQIILLMDEVESHLHPQWQRSIMPAVLEVAVGLQEQMTIQAFATTHSPLVLASLEPIFEPEIDKLFLFELLGQEVTLNEFPWTKQGDTVGWLTSEIFGLKQARSKQAEITIEAAEAWMRHDNMNAFPANLRTASQIQQELERLLPGHDPFWPRWIVKTEAHQK